jgi:hypothetical protein
MAKQHTKAALFTLKELLSKPMKYYHGIILLGILLVIYIK